MSETNSRDSSEKTFEKELSSRAISALKAYKCCTAGRAKLEQDIRRVLGELLDRVQNAKRGSAIALLPAFAPVPAGLVIPGGPAVSFPRIVEIGSRVPAGLVLLYGSTFLADTIRQTATLAATAAALEAFDQVTKPKTKDDPCGSCVKKNLWNQTNPQRRVKGIVRTRNPTKKK